MAAAMIAFITVLQAYFKTPYIRIRGRTHAFSMQDSAPDPSEFDADEPPSMPPSDSYPGRATAPKAWWLFVAIIAFFGLGGALAGWNAKTLPAAGIICLAALACGIDDATRKLPKARGQNVRATMAAALSISMTFLPPVLYLIGLVFAVRGDLGFEHHRRLPLDGHIPPSPRWPVRCLLVAEPGDVLHGHRGPTVDHGGIAEALRRNGSRLHPAGLDIERLSGQGNLAAVDEIVDYCPNPSASSISGARNVTPAKAASAIGTGSSGRLPKPMMSNSIIALSYVV